MLPDPGWVGRQLDLGGGNAAADLPPLFSASRRRPLASPSPLWLDLGGRGGELRRGCAAPERRLAVAATDPAPRRRGSYCPRRPTPVTE
jgi:hypothetical protein